MHAYPACLSRRTGGAKGNRTPDLYNAIVALYQLSYGPGIGSTVASMRRPHCGARVERFLGCSVGYQLQYAVSNNNPFFPCFVPISSRSSQGKHTASDVLVHLCLLSHRRPGKAKITDPKETSIGPAGNCPVESVSQAISGSAAGHGAAGSYPFQAAPPGYSYRSSEAGCIAML